MEYNNLARLETSLHADQENVTLGDFIISPSGDLCKVKSIRYDGTLTLEVIKNGQEIECNCEDTSLIPLSGDFLEYNGFRPTDADRHYVKYERKDLWRTYSLIFDKFRKYYSYTQVGCCIPLRTVDAFQRLLKQCGHHEELLKSLKIQDGEDNR